MRVDRRNLRKGLLAAGFMLGAPTAVGLASGLPLIALGCALHFWSKGCLEQNRRLITAGPYRFVRNPFYLANALIDAGLCVVIAQTWIAVLFAVLWAFAYRDTIAREEGHLAEIFPDEYPRYAATVPRLFPTGARWSASDVVGAFSLDNDGLARGQEYARLLGIAIGPAVVVAGALLRRVGRDLLTPEYEWALAFIVGLPVVWVVKLAVAEAFRRPESALLGVDLGSGARWACVVGSAGLALALVPVLPTFAPVAAGWCGLALLDTLAARRAPVDAARSRWRYHGPAVAGSTLACVALVIRQIGIVT